MPRTLPALPLSDIGGCERTSARAWRAASCLPIAGEVESRRSGATKPLTDVSRPALSTLASSFAPKTGTPR